MSDQGRIEFFEGNDATQDNLGNVPYLTGTYTLLGNNGPIENDEARSCRLIDVTAPGTIKLYNGPEGDLGDDWTEINILSDVTNYVVDSFDRASNDGKVQVIPHGGELDGKVSNIQVYPG